MSQKLSLYRFLDTPLALYPRVAPELLEGVRRQIIQNTRIPLLYPNERILVEVPDEYDDGDVPPYDFYGDVAIIPINGVLVNGPSYWFDESSYGDIGKSIDMAMDDSEVKAIALQIASPGGEVSGLFDLVDQVHSYKGKKPVWSIVDDHAYSAAYAIASVGDRIVLPRTGGVGSIGVVAMHFDVSEALTKFGVNISLIQYGDRKTDMSPFKPLSSEARERIQDDVNVIGELFVETVSRNRGMDRGKIRSMEAGTFMGQKGVEQGLADAVQSPQSAFDTLSQSVREKRTIMGPYGPRKERSNEEALAIDNQPASERSAGRGGASPAGGSGTAGGSADGSGGSGTRARRGGMVRRREAGRVG